MSKPRRKAMRTGHMKKFSSTMINGGSTVNAIGLKKLYYDKDINPTTPMPDRKQLAKHSPTMTVPMHEKMIKHYPGHFNISVKERKDEFVITLISYPDVWKMYYNGYTDMSTCYFTVTSHGITKTSITYPRYKALILRESLKGIIWKDA